MKAPVFACALAILAACEFQPAPPPAPPPPAHVPADAAAVAAVAAVATVAAVSDAGAPQPRADATLIAVTDDCVRTSTHIAEVLISSAADQALKASYEAARDRIVRATAEVCTTQAWSGPEQRCFVQAKVEADLRACEKKFPPPLVQPKHQVVPAL
ncbi:MAG: hypothetical protein ABI467_09725 [Kofleriaceae bacterium]